MRGIALQLLVSVWFQVLFHSPRRGSFHLSLTVLVHYRSQTEYLALPDGPGRFPQGSTCPAVLRSHWKEDCIFTYAAVTLYGRPFQTVRLTLSYPSFNQASLSQQSDRCSSTADLILAPPDYCGPATPSSPFESPGLGYSDFARHYFRNHGCFLFLRVLRWFTSPGSLRHPMNSDDDNGCSHPLGFPIRTSPDHSLLAASRGLSQLTTSFIACLRQGIHTHALSSLTIKSTSHTTVFLNALRLLTYALQLVYYKCPSIFNCQRSFPEEVRSQETGAGIKPCLLTYDLFCCCPPCRSESRSRAGIPKAGH